MRPSPTLLSRATGYCSNEGAPWQLCAVRQGAEPGPDSSAQHPILALCSAPICKQPKRLNSCRLSGREHPCRTRQLNPCSRPNRGTRLEPRNLYRAFERICDEAGASHTLHGLRHDLGSTLVAVGIPGEGCLSQPDQYSTLSGREALVAIAIKAWNAWREGKTLPTRTWRAEGRRAEPFPEAN